MKYFVDPFLGNMQFKRNSFKWQPFGRSANFIENLRRHYKKLNIKTLNYIDPLNRSHKVSLVYCYTLDKDILRISSSSNVREWIFERSLSESASSSSRRIRSYSNWASSSRITLYEKWISSVFLPLDYILKHFHVANFNKPDLKLNSLLKHLTME